jgi:hypothetical protein
VQEPAVTLVAGLPSPAVLAWAVLLLFLPGYALGALLLPTPRYAALDRLLAAPALTLALVALATLWATTLGLGLSQPIVDLVLLGAAVIAVLTGPRRWAGRPRPSEHAVAASVRTAPAWPASPPGEGARCSMAAPGSKRGSHVALGRARSALSPVLWNREAVAAGAYLALFGLALGLRLWSTRDVLPALGADTYHHALIAQLIVERGGVPESYAPYAPIQSFAYHFGFHSLVAWLHWWTGANVGELVGLAGHLLNAAVALGVAFFVRRVLGDGLVAGLAAWLIALLAVFPAYLVNWGRFTQAGGLLVLPVAAALWLDALGWAAPCCKAAPALGRADDSGEPCAAQRNASATVAASGWQVVVAAGLATGGLLLAHYRMLAALAPLLAVWAAVAALVWLADASRSHRSYRAVARRLLIRRAWSVGGGASASATRAAVAARPPGPGAPPEDGASSSPAAGTTALGVPWGLRLLGGLVGPGLVAGLATLPWLLHLPGALALGLGERPGDYGAEYYTLDRLGTAAAQPTNGPLLALATVGVGLAAWALWRTGHPAASRPMWLPGGACGAATALVLTGWAAALVALANPYWWPVPMPLAGRIDLVTVLATLCIPLAVAAAYALAALVALACQRAPRAGVVGGAVVALVGTAVGAWQLQALVTPANALVAPADLAAAAWLRANTPPDARVAVSATIFPWAPDYVVGVDGGYWLPLLAGRATTLLPMLYAGERGADPAAVRDTISVARALRDAPAAPETAALLRSLGVNYVYHGGHVATPSLAGLAANPALRLVYQGEGPHVFLVAPP